MLSAARLACALICAFVFLASTAFGQSPITYQGLVRQGGTPVTGLHDFTFRLFDQSVGGSQVGVMITALNVQVSEGRFTTALNFPSSAFDSVPRYLEIGVRPAGSGVYTTLAPRQQITAAPVALRSMTERWNDVGGGTLTNSSLVNRVMLNRTTPITGSDYFTVNAPASAGNFGGMYINTDSTGGLPFYGFATNGAARSWIQHNGTTGVMSLVNNNNLALNVDAQGRTGLGMTPSSATAERLQVLGDARVNGEVRTQAVMYTTPRVRKLTVTSGDWVTTDVAFPTFANVDGVTCGASMIAHAMPPVGSHVLSVTIRVYNNMPQNRSFRCDFIPASTNVAALQFTYSIPVTSSVQTYTHTFASPIVVNEADRFAFTAGTAYVPSVTGSNIKSVTINYEVTGEE